MNCFSKRGIRIVASWIAVVGTITACAKGEQGGEESPAGKAVVAAQVATVTAQPFTETLGAIGIVEVRAGHAASLSAPAQGRVSTVLITTGQHVSAGETLIELDQAPFHAATQSADAALAAAQREYDRSARLAQEGIVPRKQVDAAAADLARTRADAVTARRLEQLSVLRAPIAGVVTRMTATLGASADPSMPLVEIADPAAVDVVFSVTPVDAARVHPGASVALTAGQNASGEPLGSGRIAEVSGMVDSMSRNVAVRARATETRRRLRIGETVFGQIAIDTRRSAITVPLDALVPEGDGFKVFVVDPQGIAQGRDVTVGGRTTTVAEITRGLTPGERVVAYGAYGVQDSARIVPVKQP
jgi:RND family efflux transporter MFP subunit